MSRTYPDIAEHLPAEITGFDVEGTVLTIWGIDWTLTILTPWEGIPDGRAIYSDDDDLADRFRSLVGQALLGVGPVDVDDTGFQFSNGVLFVPPRPTESTWRLRLPHDEFYGRPGSVMTSVRRECAFRPKSDSANGLSSTFLVFRPKSASATRPGSICIVSRPKSSSAALAPPGPPLSDLGRLPSVGTLTGKEERRSTYASPPQN